MAQKRSQITQPPTRSRLATSTTSSWRVASEVSRINDRLPHHWRVGHNHGCARRDFIGYLVRELRTKPQARRKFVRINTATFTVHSHPPASLPLVPSSKVNTCSPSRPLTSSAARPIGLPLR